MDGRGWIARHGFWPLARGLGGGLGVLTVPAVVVAGLPVWIAGLWLARRGAVGDELAAELGRRV